jgi:hypothetical protein
MFRRNNSLKRRNHFPLSSRHPETAVGYQLPTKGALRLGLNRRQPMRTISFILGFAFILAGPSIAGSSDGNLPGIGTFSYGSPASIIVAAN